MTIVGVWLVGFNRDVTIVRVWLVRMRVFGRDATIMRVFDRCNHYEGV